MLFALHLFFSQPPREVRITAADWAEAQSGEVDRPGNSASSHRAGRQKHCSDRAVYYRAMGLSLDLYFLAMTLREFFNLSESQFLCLKTFSTKPT